MAALLAGCPDDTSPIATTSDTDTDGSSSDGGSVTNTTTMSTSLDTTADTTADTTDTTVTTTMTTTVTDSTESGSSSTDVTDTDASSSSDGGSVCGDDVADKGEECDGTDLAGEDCASQGFDTGTLACAADCTFDTSACASNCGNGTIEAPEECDGAALDGEDCVSQGFDFGTLGCAADCAFDTSACMMATCGNNTIENPEVCDGTDVAGEDCISQGFDAGTLGCAGNCMAFDTASCSYAFPCQDEDVGTATGPAVTSGNTVGDDNDIDAMCGGTGGNDRVIGFTATGAGTYQFDTFGSTYDTKIALYSDCMTQLGCNDDFGGLQSRLQLDLAAGQEILIVVDGFNGATGNWVLNITPPGVCGDATVGPGEICDGADLAGQDCVTQGFASGVLACDAMCAFDTSGCVAAVCGNGVLEIGETCDGTDLGGTSCIELGVQPSGTVSNCCFNHGAGMPGCDDMTCQDAVCAVDAFCCATTWDSACANEATDLCDPDLCPDPSCNGSCDGFGTGSCNADATCLEEDIGGAIGAGVASGNTDAEDEDIAQGCGSGGAVDHVVFFRAPATASYTFDTFGSGYDTVLSASDDCASTFACNDDSGGTAQSSITFDMTAGEGVLIAVSGYNDATGDWVLNITQTLGGTEAIDGCDVNFCTFSVGTGPNGGDVCSCTFPGASHPTGDDLGDASCFPAFSGSGRELVWSVGLFAYSDFTVTTCNVGAGDSSVATYDDDPTTTGVEFACSEDASGEPGFCSEITDDASGLTAGTPTAVPAAGLVYIVIDEWSPGSYWNGTTTRQIDLEAIP